MRVVGKHFGGNVSGDRHNGLIASARFGELSYGVVAQVMEAKPRQASGPSYRRSHKGRASKITSMRPTPFYLGTRFCPAVALATKAKGPSQSNDIPNSARKTTGRERPETPATLSCRCEPRRVESLLDANHDLAEGSAVQMFVSCKRIVKPIHSIDDRM
jgi:hypothetical protein